jgi:hypothetical protein
MFRVAHVYQNLTAAEQKKIARKQRRSRAAGAKEEEEGSVEARAREKLELRNRKEFELLVSTIAKTPSNTDLKAAYHWSDFKEMAKRIRMPLKTVIEDRRVVLSDVGCAIMMRETAIDVLKEKVLMGERKRKEYTDDRSTNKRRCIGSGNAAGDTEFGATGT